MQLAKLRRDAILKTCGIMCMMCNERLPSSRGSDKIALSTPQATGIFCVACQDWAIMFRWENVEPPLDNQFQSFLDSALKAEMDELDKVKLTSLQLVAEPYYRNRLLLDCQKVVEECNIENL